MFLIMSILPQLLFIHKIKVINVIVKRQTGFHPVSSWNVLPAHLLYTFSNLNKMGAQNQIQAQGPEKPRGVSVRNTEKS